MIGIEKGPAEIDSAGPMVMQYKPGYLLCRVFTVLVCTKQIRHYRHGRITGVVQARQTKSGFNCFKQREVIVLNVALRTMHAVVRVNDRNHLIR